MNHLLLAVWLTTSAAFGATATAQRLANAERLLESLRHTKSDTEATEAEVTSLAQSWLREELAATRALDLGPRVQRLAALSNEAARRQQPAIERDVNEQLERDLKAWFVQAHTLLDQHQPLRAVALRRSTLAVLREGHALANFDEAIEREAREQLVRGRAAAGSVAAAHAWSAALAVLSGTAEPIPASLLQLRVAKGTPTLDFSACTEADPSLRPSDVGVVASMRVTAGSCRASTSEHVEHREASYVVRELVPHEVKYTTTEMQEVEVVEPTQECKDYESCQRTSRVNEWGYTVEGQDCHTERRCIPSYTTKTVSKAVEVERTRIEQRLEDVTKVEPYAVRVADFTATGTVRIVIEGDGQRVDVEPTLEATTHEEQFTSQHGGSASFSGHGEHDARLLLSLKVRAAVEQAIEAWSKARGRALAQKASSLEQFVTAAVLMNDVTPDVSKAVVVAGLSSAESKALLVRTPLELPATPQYPSLQLPAPDSSLEDELAELENKHDVVEQQRGFTGGLQLGVTTQDRLDKQPKARFGFGLGAVMHLNPLPVRTKLILRPVLEIYGAAMSAVQLDVALRGEVGFKAGPFSFVALGLGQLLFSVDADEAPDNLPYRWPFFVGGGYGARVEVRIVRVVVEALLARIHRTWAAAPIGTRAEARLSYDLGGVVKLSLGVRINTADDVPRLFDTPSRSWFSYASLQSEF